MAPATATAADGDGNSVYSCRYHWYRRAMVPGPTGEGVLDVLRRRETVLAALVDERRGKRALVEGLPVSRSTVDRAVRELETHDLVERTNGEYRATLTGELLLSARHDYVQRVGGTGSVGDLLAHLPTGVDLPVGAVATAEVYRPDGPEPHRPVEFLRGLVKRAVRHRGLLVQQATPNAPDLIRDRVCADELDVEYLISPSMREYLWTERPALVADMIDAGGATFRETRGLPFDYGLLSTAETTYFVVVVHDDNGSLQGVLCNDATAAVEWGRTTYNRHRADARLVDPPEE